MEYRQLGGTELKISVLGLGLRRWGMCSQDGAGGAECGRALCGGPGINFFDVSPYYGLTLAEARLGEALAGGARRCAGDQVRAVWGQRVRLFGEDDYGGFEESLKRLRTDYVDLLQAHDVSLGTCSRW